MAARPAPRGWQTKQCRLLRLPGAAGALPPLRPAFKRGRGRLGPPHAPSLGTRLPGFSRRWDPTRRSRFGVAPAGGAPKGALCSCCLCCRGSCGALWHPSDIVLG